MLASSPRHRGRRRRQHAGHLLEAADRKVVRFARRQPVPIPEQRGNLIRHHVERHPVGRRDRDAMEMRDAEQLLLHGRVGDDDGVVLVPPHRGLALVGKDPDHAERLVLDADAGASGIGAGTEQLIAHHRAEHGDLAGAGHVLFGEERAVLERPRANGRDIGARTLDLRVPVGRLGDHLLARAGAWRNELNARDVARDRRRIVGRQCRRVARAGADGTEVARPGIDRHDVRAGAPNLRLDRLLCAVADRHHDDHGRDADDHAERGERRPHRVATQRLDGHRQRR